MTIINIKNVIKNKISQFDDCMKDFTTSNNDCQKELHHLQEQYEKIKDIEDDLESIDDRMKRIDGLINNYVNEAREDVIHEIMRENETRKGISIRGDGWNRQNNSDRNDL